MACLIRLFFLAAVVLAGALPAGAAQKAALVIGNSAYRSVTPLVNPANDANDMAAALGRIGYAVTLVKDGDLVAMNDGLRAFLRDADHADSVVVFYSGHGVQVKGRNYLVPVSAKISDELDLDTQTLSLDKLLELVDSAAPKVKIVILDSCRDNPLTRQLTRGAGTRGLARIDLDASSAKGTLIAFSTAPGSVAQDGSGRNSPFTTALLAHMETPGLDIRQMFGQVRADVDQSTQGGQTPWVNEAIIGSFAMAGKAENVQPAKAAGATTSVLVDPPATQGATDMAPAVTTSGDNQTGAAPQQNAALDFAVPDRTVPASVSPSFPCNGRLNPTENAICQDGGLAGLDQTLSSAYGMINAALPKDLQAKLKANQTAWRAQRDECGADAACIGVSYRQRLAFLKGLVDKAAGTPSVSPSFPCGGRLNPSERAICQSDTLARLDLALDGVFKARFRGLAKADQVALSASQTAWRSNRDRCGATASCIEAAYRQRLNYFQSLQ
ncbi:caspase family protein [Labrys sedimenti]|uniref:caspase family protein n=1 Tax=Labrys sedimenti TaxID=3106036 RepID=UPI002ACA4B90|nr:caspase family protein [Labrys sp. ZIDIC5]MDZ5452918.1 caspase family protein [Labrys sp. ZIDIC5]